MRLTSPAARSVPCLAKVARPPSAGLAEIPDLSRILSGSAPGVTLLLLRRDEASATGARATGTARHHHTYVEPLGAHCRHRRRQGGREPRQGRQALQGEQPAVRFLTDDEETALRDAIGEEEWPMAAVAIHTGLRQAEQFKLRWEHVDFATGLLTVPRSKHGETRRVPMNDTVRDILRT